MSEEIQDEDWEDWKPGDLVIWEEECIYDEERREGPFIIDHIAQGYVWFTNGDMTRETNLLRIKENIDATANH